MVQYVIKRDGTIEEFSSDKLNKWAEWASDSCGVSWSDVLLTAVKAMPDTISTADIHRSLIKTCIEMKDKGHVKMAARLLVGQIYKEAFGDYSIPSLKDYYHEMVDAGHWDFIQYSDEALDQLDTVIDHTKDFTYEYATVRQFYDKYAISVDGVCLESPQMMMMGLAMSNNAGGNLDEVVAAYKAISDLKINLPTPTLNGERTSLQSSPSCCVITGGDTTESIGAATMVAYEMTGARAGIGIEYATRSINDPVKGGRVSHTGKFPLYSFVDKAVKALTQVSRGGSATVTFTCMDPEVEMLLRLKSQRTDIRSRLDHLDYSLAVNNLFLSKVAKNEDWMLVSSYYAPELWELFYSPDVDAFAVEYDRVMNSNVKKTIIPARKIMDAFLSMRNDTGRLYLTFINNVNSHTPFKEKVRLSNLCVAPETNILTRKGHVPIVEMAGESVDIWNGEEWSTVDVVKTGENQKLLRVVTDSGQELECTEYHKWYVVDGYGAKPREVRTVDLVPGDKLIKFDLPVIEGDQNLDLAYQNGFFSGDGCVTSSGDRIYLYGEKRSLKEHFGDVKWHDNDDQNRSQTHIKGLQEKFFVPGVEYTISDRLVWLAGYMDADGCVYRNGENSQLVATSTNYEFLKNVQNMLQTVGVFAKIRHHSEAAARMLPLNDGTGNYGEFDCQAAWRLIITSCDLHRLNALGFKCKRLEITDRVPQRDARQFVKVVEVVDDGRYDDTYCFTEEKRGMGMFNGILTGQCQEIALPTKPIANISNLYDATHEESEIALCFLASLVVSKLNTVDEYLEAAYVACKTIDNTIEGTAYPYPQLENSSNSRRSIGVGMTDVAHWMASQGLKYDTVEGRNAIHRLAELHSYALHKASVRLAKERGPCAWFHKTKYSKERPWLPIDTYKSAVDEHHTQELLCDWEGLREEIKQYGMRFSVLEAFMPVESSSVFTASTNGLYPIRNHQIYKKSKRGIVFFEAPGWDELEYQNAYDIDTLDMVKFYSIVQKFTGQGISADFYSDLRDGKKQSMKDLYQQVFMSAKLGMKTWYYLNFLTVSEEPEEAKAPEEYEEAACDSCTL